MAAKSGHQVFKEAKKRGWNMNEYNGIIHIAAREGRKEAVSFLIENGVNVNEKDQSGNIPLHHACSRGHAEVAGILLNHRSYVDAENKQYNTPLLLSINNGNVETTKLLLNAKLRNQSFTKLVTRVWR